jgi:outer membrane protein assembly factor BamE (lipoprotein component of BamABCDE complex)
MKVITLTKALIIFLIIVASSCAFFHSTQKKEVTHKKQIIKGVTTETTVVTLLGMPVSVNPNSIGDEVWNYKNLTYSTRKSDDEKTLTLWELTNGDSKEVPPPYNLLITFDQNDIVKDFERVFINLENQ